MTTFPFTAIVGEDELKLALEIAVVDRSIGGVLAFGDRGTGKSTAIRALARLLPPMRVADGCAYHCDPATECEACDENGRVRNEVEVPVPVVDLPLGATEDRVVGALDLEAALTRGERTLIRAGRAAASLDGRHEVTDRDLARVAPLALRHRLRRSPLDEVGSGVRIDKAIADVLSM